MTQIEVLRLLKTLRDVKNIHILRLEVISAFERMRSLVFFNFLERQGSFWGRKCDIGVARLRINLTRYI